ncbi:MAG: SPOR domain-containing protein [Bryobacterales bacterium]|nr:SPOR domain-containing protein [Bryobacterales bacterium]
MPKSDESHYELVLGNRQLVSGFFVLVILFAIFLTLGYILGRNSVVVNEPGSVAGAVNGDAARPAGADAPQPSSTMAKPSASESGGEPPPATPAQDASASTASPMATKPAETAPQPVAAKPDTTPATTSPASATTERTREILGGKVQVITPRKGDVFLQVAAVGRPEAELMAEQLQKRSYRAFLSEVPNKDLFRVLVGPFETAARLNETKQKLSGEGLPSIVQRY